MDKQQLPAQQPQPVGQTPQPPQVVYVQVPSMASVQRKYLAAALLGASSLVGFFFLPLVDFYGLGATGVQVATSDYDVSLRGLWVTVITAGFAVLFGISNAITQPTKRGQHNINGVILVVASVVGGGVLGQFYANVVSTLGGASYLGSGFWLCAISNVLLLIVGFAVLDEGSPNRTLKGQS